MSLKKKLVIAGLSLVAFAPVVAQAADASSLFKTQRRVYNLEYDGAASSAPQPQQNIMQSNPCLEAAAKQVLGAIENSPAYTSALNSYHAKCASNASLADPSFVISADYEPIKNSQNYSCTMGVSVQYKNSTRALWASSPAYVARVGTGLHLVNGQLVYPPGGTTPPECPSITQWQQQLNIPAVQGKIVSELTADTQTCSGPASNGYDDGFDSKDIKSSKSPAAAQDGVVQSGSWFGNNAVVIANQPQ